MCHFTRLSYFFVLSFILIASCKSQNEEKNNGKKAIIIENKQVKKDIFNPKDLKLLSNYIDTLRLDNYLSEINKFKEDDSLHPNRKFDIVFVGSSSIRKWENLDKDLPGFRILNRGFGGSTIPEAIYYSDILFFNHKTSKIVLYTGDNDVAWLNTGTKKVVESYKLLYRLLNSKLPKTSIYILSIKPSPARWEHWPQMLEVNNSMKKFCLKKTNAYFIDVSKSMIDSLGNIKKELFVKDGVHLNKNGYKLWTDIVSTHIGN